MNLVSMPPTSDVQDRLTAGVEMIKAALAEAYPGMTIVAETFVGESGAGVAIAAHSWPDFDKIRLDIYRVSAPRDRAP